LREIGFETKILIDSSFTVLDKGIDGFVQGLCADDTAVLYYSGHGFSLNGTDYLPSLETELPSNEGAAVGSSITISALLDRLAQSKAGEEDPNSRYAFPASQVVNREMSGPIVMSRTSPEGRRIL
jgi:hypothetical protein